MYHLSPAPTIFFAKPDSIITSPIPVHPRIGPIMSLASRVTIIIPWTYQQLKEFHRRITYALYQLGIILTDTSIYACSPLFLEHLCNRKRKSAFTIGVPLSPFHWHIIHCSISIRFIRAPASQPTNLRHLHRCSLIPIISIITASIHQCACFLCPWVMQSRGERKCSLEVCVYMPLIYWYLILKSWIEF